MTGGDAQHQRHPDEEHRVVRLRLTHLPLPAVSPVNGSADIYTGWRSKRKGGIKNDSTEEEGIGGIKNDSTEEEGTGGTKNASLRLV